MIARLTRRYTLPVRARGCFRTFTSAGNAVSHRDLVRCRERELVELPLPRQLAGWDRILSHAYTGPVRVPRHGGVGAFRDDRELPRHAQRAGVLTTSGAPAPRLCRVGTIDWRVYLAEATGVGFTGAGSCRVASSSPVAWMRQWQLERGAI